ncbi:MAG: energy-coupling factor ABC transporter ATP-binding protein [Spirochaetales bacterium]|nr:energy-coupling factor ABC transporter ATP-binding protein [Spirochaetales bacterium]
MALLSVDNLSFSIDGTKLLENISFFLEKGSLTLIAGKNGSGKSMLLKCLKGLEKPDGGRITIDGRELKRERERMRAFGLVFQDTSLEIVGSTVRKDIAFGLENLRWERERIQETTDRMVSLFNLEKIQNLPPSVLSGGEKRRLSIAGVLAMEPEIILMDEPLANLDYPSIKMVLSTLLELKEKGITIIIVSHEAEKLLSLTDNTIILSEGKIVNMGKSRDMMDALRNNEVYLPPKANFEDLSWLK